MTAHWYIASYENSDVLVFESSHALLGYVEAADVHEITVWDDQGSVYELTSPDDIEVRLRKTESRDIEGLRNTLDTYIARIADHRGVPRPEWGEDDLQGRVVWLATLPPLRPVSTRNRISDLLRRWRRGAG